MEHSQTKYLVDHLSDDELADICRNGLERGELWRPDVRVKPADDGNGFVWFDSEDGSPSFQGPFESARAALIDAMEVEGVEEPAAWGVLMHNEDRLSLLTVYARYEPTADPVTLQYWPNSKKRDVVVYRDRACSKLFARFCWAMTGKPTRNHKTIMLNCFKWPVVWLADLKKPAHNDSQQEVDDCVRRVSQKDLDVATNVKIEVDCSESDQLSSFQNGTLQSFGNGLAVTIQTQLVLPGKMEGCTQEQAVEYLREILGKASSAVENQISFDVQIGLSADDERQRRGGTPTPEI